MLQNGNTIGTDDKFDASSRVADYFTIRNWLGLLSGRASTNIIHMDMYGQIDIEITGLLVYFVFAPHSKWS